MSSSAEVRVGVADVGVGVADVGVDVAGVSVDVVVCMRGILAVGDYRCNWIYLR
jgi:hypothetical protein